MDFEITGEPARHSSLATVGAIYCIVEEKSLEATFGLSPLSH